MAMGVAELERVVEKVDSIILVNAEVTWNDNRRWRWGTAWESVSRVLVSGIQRCDQEVHRGGN